MERLTMNNGLCQMASTEFCFAQKDCYSCPHGRKCFKALAAYEDTWLSPEEYKRHVDAIKKLDIEHMHDLLQAEMDGRLVVLPCKVGDVAYVVAPGDYEHEHRPYVREKAVREISWKSTSTKDLGWGLILAGGKCNTSARYKLNSIGKTVFLTREEAEAALKNIKEEPHEQNKN